MKYILLACLLLIPQKSELQIKYNRIEDRTTISTKPESKGSLSFFLYVSHPGQKLTKPLDTVFFVIESYSRDGQFRETKDVYVLADDERFTLSNPTRNPDIDINSRSVRPSERLMFALSKSQLKRIVNARKVEMKIGVRSVALGTRGTYRAMVNVVE